MQHAKKIPKTLEDILPSGSYTTSYETVFILALSWGTLELWNNTLLVLFLIIFGIKLNKKSDILVCLKPISYPSPMTPENPYDYICKYFNMYIFSM